MPFKHAAWWERMNCIDADPAIFEGSGKRRSWDQARALCRACPVQLQCLAEVLAMPITGPVDRAFAANHTPHELDVLRKRQPLNRWRPSRAGY